MQLADGPGLLDAEDAEGGGHDAGVPGAVGREKLGAGAEVGVTDPISGAVVFEKHMN